MSWGGREKEAIHKVCRDVKKKKERGLGT